MNRRLSTILLAAAGVLALTHGGVIHGQTATAPTAAVDKIFARFGEATPGCAVGVSRGGTVVLTKAYGMANLEHGVGNTPDTIFEAGSVSKQFTAAAVLLLAQDGKLSLDDPIRKYIPEVPDYGTPVTIRHLLTHTSGLRDWGSVAGIGGWPRTSRAYTHAHVLDIVSRQRALNFPPGTRYSYSNTGYNLSAILVARVSGMPFADFTQQRLFGPLGMARTSWRDDHRRIVKDRAVAYSRDQGAYRILMPFENVHGNGGLLTTVGDLLIWDENYASAVVGGGVLAREQETPGRFVDGRPHGYGLGLMVGSRHGIREVAHSGSTAGYRAHLTRYPAQRLSVAVLCNAGDATATPYAEAVADLYLTGKAAPAPAAGRALTAAEAEAATGLFRDTTTGEAVTVSRTDTGVRIGRGLSLATVSATRFTAPSGSTWEVTGPGSARLVDRYGTVDTYERVAPATPTASELAELTGTYASDDAETVVTAAVQDGALVLKQRPDTVMTLSPRYKDAFEGDIGTVLFRRDASGRVTSLSVVQDRVWDMPFIRRDASPSTAPR